MRRQDGQDEEEGRMMKESLSRISNLRFEISNRSLFIIHHSAFIVSSRRCLNLRRLQHLALLDAGGADLHAARRALRGLDANLLKVGVEAPPGAVVRVRDVVAELRTLAAHFASFCHDCLKYLRASGAPRASKARQRHTR